MNLHRKENDSPQQCLLSEQHRLHVLEVERLVFICPVIREVKTANLSCDHFEILLHIGANDDHTVEELLFKSLEKLLGLLFGATDGDLLRLLLVRPVVFLLGQCVVNDQLLLVRNSDHELLEEVEGECSRGKRVNRAIALVHVVSQLCLVYGH